ncbi:MULTISPECIES: hypothetical protein [Flavobacterium]|nr:MULTISPECIES: hypothetical protein [Flavobacterium]
MALAKNGNILTKASFKANFIPAAKAGGNLKENRKQNEENFATD